MAALTSMRSASTRFMSTLLGGLGLLGGCGPALIHAPSQAQLIDPAEVRSSELERHLCLGHGVDVFATLWDAALVAGEGTLPASTQQRWQARYLDDTSFLVVVELSQSKEDDPLLDPSAWKFGLRTEDGAWQQPKRVAVEGIERSPTGRGRHDVRLLLSVHFRGDLHEQLKNTGDTTWVELRVKVGEEGVLRPALGLYAAKKGLSMRWRVRSAASDAA